MQKTLKIVFVLAIIIFQGTFSFIKAQSLGFQIGLSTPNNEMNNVYNEDNISLGHFERAATDIGFNLGLKLRIPYSKNTEFTGGLMWNRFSRSTITVVTNSATTQEPIYNNDVVTLNTFQNIFSLTGGVNIHFLQLLLFNFYASGDLQYNQFFNSVSFDRDISWPEERSPSYGRGGVAFGLGTDINIPLLKLNLDVKYNMSNLFGMEKEEKLKNFYAIGLGIYF